MMHDLIAGIKSIDQPKALLEEADIKQISHAQPMTCSLENWDFYMLVLCCMLSDT